MANTKIFPPGIELLRITTNQLDPIIDVFKLNSQPYVQLRDLVKKTLVFDNEVDFYSSKRIIGYLQTLMLLGLSMHGGIFTPTIKTISCKNNLLKISWKSGVHDQFKFGVFDDNFKKFAFYFQKKMFFNEKAKREIPVSIVKQLRQILLEYIEELKSCDKKIQSLIKDQFCILSTLEDDKNRDLIFILISCLPREELNSLFLYVQQFFPPDLKIKIEGKTFNVTNLFQQPSSDMKSLMHKSNVYFELFFSVRMPIIHHITKTKTKDFLADLIKKTHVYEQLIQNLKSLRDNQITMRLTLYEFFLKHLKGLF
jgi:hypothetical protein